MVNPLCTRLEKGNRVFARGGGGGHNVSPWFLELKKSLVGIGLKLLQLKAQKGV